jgi:glycine betaine/proline transport system ATP-binding protein
MIHLRHLTKIFGSEPERALERLEAGAEPAVIREDTGQIVAVRDVSLDIASGEIFVIMGLSGSGKSTLLRCINRLVEPTRGTVEIDGEDVTAVSAERLRKLRRTRMTMVFQHFGLFPHRTVLGNVEYGMEVGGMPRAERRDRAREALALVGLESYADRRTTELSGGMQQRVGLARALANEPEILLMDEPFSALDPLIRTEMQEELLDLQARLHRTIVFITHDLDEALALGDRIAIMKDGAVIQVGTPEEILLDPADDYVRAFVQNVDRTKVLTAAALMRDAPPDAECGTTVRPGTPLAELISVVLDAEGPVAVIDEAGAVLGVVDADAVVAEVARNASGGS